MSVQQTDKFEHARKNAKGWYESIVEMLGRLDEPDGENEEAREEIERLPLSVEVRDGWKLPGAESDGPEEYKILLTTGGPALRIVGELGQHGEPQSAELQMQDWGVPWTRYAGADEDVLLRFARCFYFGE